MADQAKGFGRHAFAGVTCGVEPAIVLAGPRGVPLERRVVSSRWLGATVLTGIGGAALIATAVITSVNHRGVVPKQPEYAVQARRGDLGSNEGLKRGDRLVRKADIVAERQSFQAPTAVTVGDKQVIRLRGYTRVATTLTLVPTDQADQVPAFNPLKLLGDDQPSGAPDAPADPGPVLDASEVAFVTVDLGGADPRAFGPGLSKEDVAAQVAEQIRVSSQAGPKAVLSLPPQFLLMRASRPSLDPANLLAYATAGVGLGVGLSDLEGAAPGGTVKVRMTAENVTSVPRNDALHDAGQVEERLVVLRHGDTLDGLLRDNGASRDQIRRIVDAFGARRGEPPVQEGRRLRLLKASIGDGDPPQIARLSVYADEALEATVALADDGRYVKVDAVDPRKTPRAAAPDEEEDEGGLRLYDSLYQTALKQQIPSAVIATMMRVLSNDIDFQQPVQAGDSFDAFFADDEDGDGRPDLLFASVTIRNEIFRYYRFQGGDDGPEYFDDNGRSMRKFLIRTPVTAGVFTSGFGMRFHPVLGYSRPHTGVDWAAPVGTPILAAGNGTVLTAERSSSYGNHIEIQHANGYITTYSHMVGFARGITSGTRVRQGQVIGYLGQTGLATGPHLHYEVMVNNRFVDPMRVKLSRSRDLAGPQVADFKREHARIDALMASAPNAQAVGPQARATN